MDLADLLSPDASLASLAAVSFLAATLVPMSSEAALFAVLRLHPDLAWPAIAIATAGNTAGGMTSYAIGRFLASKRPLKQVEAVQRWGAPALLLAWAPIVGDALAVAAGWLRLAWLPVLAFQAAGRFARYWAVAHAAALL